VSDNRTKSDSIVPTPANAGRSIRDYRACTRS
jgi:hypothetical protein